MYSKKSILVKYDLKYYKINNIKHNINVYRYI